MYAIIKKDTKEFFSGFDKNKNPTFSNDENNAWKTSLKPLANAQISALKILGLNIQRKSVIV